MDANDGFYLGRTYDLDAGSTSDEPLIYDPEDLTTHAVVVGMTGSGKTGLCLDLLEEAALSGTPALMIDPKGDITNALLHFPNLDPLDFEPWVDADQARREGKTVSELAGETAELWRNGLDSWGIQPDRLQALKDSVEFTVYTPGSDAGIPVSILASLAAPDLNWEANKELLRERISSTVTALLGLIGLDDVDPIRSREHILLANIFEQAWKRGQDLTLGELIMQTQSPPLEKLGVFDVNTFFPEKDRFELAMLLNNILAAPAFQTWIEGQPLDIGGLLFAEDGRPRHSVFYIAHLEDAERMFFVSLLFSAVETWMRGQGGSKSLKALIYFDEIFGYLPPVGNPPSKESLLRMLKQARAFGIGLVLATQNPVDVDYKALSNTGTWFVGKLQTDQDKQRLLDGLTGASDGMDRGELDALISRLDKRVFLMHNVHERQSVVFKTRWAMNYLAGPATRLQIPLLNELAGVDDSPLIPELASPIRDHTPPSQEQRIAKDTATAPAQPFSDAGSTTRPLIATGISEYFLPHNLTLGRAIDISNLRVSSDAETVGMIYKPALLAQAEIRIVKRKYDLDIEMRRTALVIELDRRGAIRWENWQSADVDHSDLDNQPLPGVGFDSLDDPFSDGRRLKSLERDFQEWLYRTTEVMVRANETLDVYASDETSAEAFAILCADAAKERSQMEMDKVSDSYSRKLTKIVKRLKSEERELLEDEAELDRRKQEETLSHAETLLSMFSKRRRSLSSSMTKRRMTERARDDVEESIETIKTFETDIEALQREKEEALGEVAERWEEIAQEVDEIRVTPYKKDIYIDLYGVAWFPHHVLRSGDSIVEVPGYAGES
jgi:DNA helicase HerA-like ATPase